MPRVRIRPHQGIVGEDRKDWLAGEEHEASERYARYLIQRGVAELVEDEPPLAEPDRAGLATDNAVNRMARPGRTR